MLFISFEGPEGAGKSTQLARLAAELERSGLRCLKTREPGGTPLGDELRRLLLDPQQSVNPLSEFLLYSASRAQLLSEVIRPALQRGEVVLCDRYADSTLAYQGAGRGLPEAFLRDVTWEATGGLRPHLTFLLDLDPELGLERAGRRGAKDRLESADLRFHQRVREGFLRLARAEPERFTVLDATRSPEDLQRDIWAVVSATLDMLTALP